MPSRSRMFGIYPEGKLVALLDWLGGSSQKCASNICSWSMWNWTNQCCMPPILVLHSSWIQYNGPSSWVYLYGGCLGCLRWVFSWCSMLSTIMMTFLTQQTKMTEMTQPKKSPSTIEKTQSMRWRQQRQFGSQQNIAFRRILFFCWTLWPWLIVLLFRSRHLCGVVWLFFIMISAMNDCLKWNSMMWHALFYLYQMSVSCANGSVGNKY